MQDADFGLPGKEEYQKKEYKIIRYLIRHHDTAKR